METAKIDTNGLRVLAKMDPNGKGDFYTAAILRPEHLAHVVTQHRAAIDALPADQKSFLLPKADEYFRSHLSPDSPGNAVIGIIGDDGTLLAQGIMHRDEANTSIIQSVSVNPDNKAGGLVRGILLPQWIIHAKDNGAQNVGARMESRNLASLAMFLKAGLHIVAVNRDPARIDSIGNARCTFDVSRNITAPFNQAAKASREIMECPLEDIHRQSLLLNQGYVGTHMRGGRTLCFEKI